MLNKLLPQENIYYAIATDRATNFRKKNNIDKQESKKDESQLSPTLLLKKHAPIIITSNHSEAKYRIDGINNGARGYIDSIQTNKKDPSIVDAVWIVFIDSTIGQKLREDKRYLSGNITFQR